MRQPSIHRIRQVKVKKHNDALLPCSTGEGIRVRVMHAGEWTSATSLSFFCREKERNVQGRTNAHLLHRERWGHVRDGRMHILS
ncbi:MAG: hypothetical protein DRN21_00100 [Thermoplasmata archaeon]|nr:MAG: hypothetical protein DRN21_00100 [Thermoplasmata archaeon]